MLTINLPAFPATDLATGEGFMIGRAHVIVSRGNQLESLASSGGCNGIDYSARRVNSFLDMMYR